MKSLTASHAAVRRGLAAVMLLLGTYAIWAVSPGPAVTGQPSKPNIIFILTDDLDASSVKFMPRLKSLMIDRGTSFEKFFVTTPICCPSRASILTGQYAHNHGVYTNTEPRGGFKKFHDTGKERSTIATWLKAAGYRTMLGGKYLNGYWADGPMYVPPGWDEWHARFEDFTTYYYNYRLNENGRVVQYAGRPEDYLTDVLTRKATDFIERAASEAVPFFIYLAPSAPHGKPIPALRHENEFAGVSSPRSPSFNEQNLSDKPKWLRRMPMLSPAAIQAIDEFYRKRLQSLRAVDEMIEKIIRTLEARGVLNNTFIFFTSDNGFHLGQHRLTAGKGTAYEEDIRVPLIARGPGVPVGGTIEHLALNIDVAPTLAQLAGASAPDWVDGRSLVPLLTTGAPSVGDWRRDFLVEHWAHTGLETPGYIALRTRQYLFVRYKKDQSELYDLASDPYELKNVYDSAPPSLINRLAERLNALKRCKAETCRN